MRSDIRIKVKSVPRRTVVATRPTRPTRSHQYLARTGRAGRSVEVNGLAGRAESSGRARPAPGAILSGQAARAGQRTQARPPSAVSPRRLPTELYVSEASPAPARLSPAVPRSIRRFAWGGVLLLVLVAVGVRAEDQGRMIKGELTASTTVAKEAFTQGRASLAASDYPAARQQFTIAEQALHRANTTLAGTGQRGGLVGAQGSGSLSVGQQLLTSGELLAKSARQFTIDLEQIQTDLAARGNNLYQSGEVLASRLPDLQRHLAETDSQLRLLNYVVVSAKHTSTSSEVQDVTRQLDGLLPEALAGVDKARTVVGGLPELLGVDRFKQYLVMFQNPAELRATGGFVGTYGRLTVDNGSIKELLVDSIYGPANQANRVIKDPAPKPYERFYSDADKGKPLIWGMQDVNWSPDFPATARRFQDYYEKSGGPTTDGVLAINTLPILAILGIVGPVPMPEYDYALTADNFQTLIQQDQEAKAVVGEADPKKILREFTPKLLAKIGQANPEQRAAVYRVLTDAVAKRDIFVYFDNSALEWLASNLDMTGAMRREPNSLSVVDVNIAGKKTSVDIATSLSQNSSVAEDGRVTTVLTLTRRHLAATAPEDVNKNYTRVFLPKGSTVVASDGFDGDVAVDEEDGFTVVGGWTDVAPLAERTVHLTYVLPTQINLASGAFPLLYQKQSGTTINYTAEVTLPGGYAWDSAAAGEINGRAIRLRTVAATDINRLWRFNHPAAGGTSGKNL